MLVKQVVEALGREFSRVRTFATLSPIPGFRWWLTERATTAPGSMSSELTSLVVKHDDVAVTDIATASASLREELMGRCARYLVSTDVRAGALDTVARFHLANGARLECQLDGGHFKHRTAPILRVDGQLSVSPVGSRT